MKIEARDGELVAIKGRSKGKKEPTPHSPQQFYSMLVSVKRERGYQDGWVFHKSRERFPGRDLTGFLRFRLSPIRPSAPG